jgi:uncharacterized protein YqjF (DUF2071 family)
MGSLLPPRRVLPLIRQSWRMWVRALAVRAIPHPPLVPPHLQLDLCDGTAWVTLTPFTTPCELCSILPLPGPRQFPETNVRTYVRAAEGTDGLLFLSLDVPNRANVVCGRALGLPYHVATLHRDHPDVYRYSGCRSGEV